MDREHRRLSRERQTVEAMVRIACRGRHSHQEGLCSECEELLSYALHRLDRCPYQASKPTCAKCPIHCYRPAMREEIRSVMKYAGPRMLLHHPVLALAHVVDGWRKQPTLSAPGESRGKDTDGSAYDRKDREAQ